MATRITDTRMTSDTTSHSAWPTPEGWQVSYLPGHWSRNQAITAMTLAEAYAERRRKPEPPQPERYWPHVQNWAAELGLTREQVWAYLADTYPPADEDQGDEADRDAPAVPLRSTTGPSLSDREKKYEGFTILASGLIFYDRKPLWRDFPTARTDVQVTGYRTPMTELREADEFIGPDEVTRYVVIKSIAEDPNGWLYVRKPGVPHEWDASAQGWTDEGFFAYTYPDTVLVYRMASENYGRGFRDGAAVELAEVGAAYADEFADNSEYRRGLSNGRAAVIDDRLAKAQAAGEMTG